MSDASAAAIQQGMQDAGWNASDLWIAAMSIGGALSFRDVDGVAAGKRTATAIEHDILAVALNDYFMETGEDHPVRYWRDL